MPRPRHQPGARRRDTGTSPRLAINNHGLEIYMAIDTGSTPTAMHDALALRRIEKLLRAQLDAGEEVMRDVLDLL